MQLEQYGLLADNININDELIKLKELPATFLSAAQAGPVYIWVENGAKNGELLYMINFGQRIYEWFRQLQMQQMTSNA